MTDTATSRTTARRRSAPATIRSFVPALAALVMSLTAGVTSGCADRTLVRDQLEHRSASRHQTAGVLIERERSSPHRLKRTARWFSRQLWPDARRLDRLHVHIRRWTAREQRRHERLGDFTLPQLGRQLRGQLQRIEPVAIRLLY